MEISKLMAGIGVVIDDAYRDDNKEPDDAYEDDNKEPDDPIFEIVKTIEDGFSLPCYKTDRIPADESTCKNLLSSASFILLDWKLWQSDAKELEKEGIAENVMFLRMAKEYFIPVFIFTNESADDVITAISEQTPSLYNTVVREKNFIFIEQKTNLVRNRGFEVVQDWISENASVYTLKSWEQAFYNAKRSLFSSMYERSPDWPRVFWKSYSDDGTDASSSIMQLINESLLGRMKTDVLEENALHRDDNNESDNVSDAEIRSLISEACLIRQDLLPEGEIRTGDLFKTSGGKYLINIRPDCDCVPRGRGQTSNDVELYCIQGKKMSISQVCCAFHRNGYFLEKVMESIVFAADEGKSIRFDFRRLCKIKYGTMKEKRIGRLIHPYITRIQQRYTQYLQRQGLPTIPASAIPDITDQ